MYVGWLRRAVKEKRNKSKGTLGPKWIESWSRTTHCALTGLPFVRAGSRLGSAPHPQSPSLDRLDPNKGYTEENTRVISFFANVAKSSWPDEHFKLLVMAAASHMRH